MIIEAFRGESGILIIDVDHQDFRDTSRLYVSKDADRVPIETAMIVAHVELRREP